MTVCVCVCVCVRAYCGVHCTYTSVTGPDHPVHISPRSDYAIGTLGAREIVMEIVCRGRVLSSLLHGLPTQVSCVCVCVSFIPDDRRRIQYNIILQFTHRRVPVAWSYYSCFIRGEEEQDTRNQ